MTLDVGYLAVTGSAPNVKAMGTGVTPCVESGAGVRREANLTLGHRPESSQPCDPGEG